MGSKLGFILILLTLIYTAQMQNTAFLTSYYKSDTKGMNDEELVDYKLRSEYWFLLRNAQIIFHTSIPSQNRQIHFSIYMNIIGTFLSIASIPTDQRTVNINTFIRLGMGTGRKEKAGLSDIPIDPFFIEFRLEEKEYKVKLNQFGDFSINGVEFKFTESNDTPSDAAQDLENIDIYLRKAYWQYLRNSELVKDESIKVDEIKYYLLTYSSEVTGSFLIISSVKGHTITVHTFVRLGAAIKKAVIPQDDFFFVPGFSPDILMIG